MKNSNGKRWTVTGYPAAGPEKRGKVTHPAKPARVRLHLLPAGSPLETTSLELLRRLHEDLGRAIEWLEAQQDGTTEAGLVEAGS